jgi:hypothetical protein
MNECRNGIGEEFDLKTCFVHIPSTTMEWFLVGFRFSLDTHSNTS